ncbi:RHS repeat domain-containing protein [Seonamhaeicola sp.]|uniref:RHS repeat domain-containing protein n=1 Tax=Seonamhaeicola sp. TaxID=1912245 RepID=UPI00260BEA74|nr:RHS repeat domain-containing protein [Seonamhaeicola sp.]
MNAKRLILILKVLVSTFIVNAQTGSYNAENPNLSMEPKSPEAATLGKYITMPMNLSSGAANIEIPIFEVQYGDLNVPISLSYDTSGIRVDELSGSVGLKWNLNYGGVLSRTARGRRDEGNYGNDNYYNSAGTPPNIRGWYNNSGLTDLYTFLGDSSTNLAETQGYNTFITNLGNGYFDSQPDLFAFNGVGYSGKFFFDQNKTPVLFTQSDAEIINTNPSGTTLDWSDWVFKMSNGHHLTFAESNNAIELNGSTDISGSTPLDMMPDAWYLTTYSSSKTGREITFSYDTESYEEISMTYPDVSSVAIFPAATWSRPDLDPILEEYIRAVFGTGALTTNSTFGVFSTSYAPCEMSSNRINVAVKEKPIIKEIIAGDTKVSFVYTDNRLDLFPVPAGESPKTLNEIIVYHKTSVVKKFKFIYSYYSKDPGVTISYPTAYTNSSAKASAFIPYAEKRLRLDTLEETDAANNVVRTYNFEYNSDYLTSRLSRGKDIWGFYNGHDANKSLYPKSDYINVLLAESSTWQDESTKMNAWGIVWNGREVSTTHANQGNLSKVTYPTGGSTELEYESHELEAPISSGYLQSFSEMSLFGSFNSLGATQGNIAVKHFNTFNVVSPYLDYTIQGGPPWNPQLGGACNVASNWQLRIYDNDTNQILISKSLSSNLYSTQGTEPLPLNKNLRLELDPVWQTNGEYCYYSRAEVKHFNASQPTSTLVGGLRVKKMQFKDSGGSLAFEKVYQYENGKLVHTPFMSNLFEWDYGDWTRGGRIDMTLMPEHAQQSDYKEGKFYYFSPNGTSPFRTDFIGNHILYGKVTELANEGTTESTFILPKTFYELEEDYQWSSALQMLPFPPHIQTDMSGKLASSKVYDKNSTLVRQTTNTYESFKQPTGVDALLASNFMVNNTLIPLDIWYTIEPEVSRLIKTTEKVLFSSGEVETSKEYLYESSNHFQPTKEITQITNGEELIVNRTYPPDLVGAEPYMTELVQENRISQPIITKSYKDTKPLQTSKTIFKSENGHILPFKEESLKGTDDPANLEHLLTYNAYDSHGNLLEIKKENGISITYIWGYSKEYPIAKIENFTSAQASSIQSLITAAETASGADNDRTVDIINPDGSINYQGNEGALRQALANIRSHSNLDNALVTTYTYDPLIGVTSITDPKGYTTYYKYDDFNRLESVKDANGNILSQNQYHYKGQQ